MIERWSDVVVVLGLALGADCAAAQGTAPAATREAQGMVMLDYQVISIAGNPSIDLIGFHFFNRMNEWLYLGVGGYAPLLRGEYGGFVAIDVTAHAQYKIWGNLYADAGLAAGGGGGGKSAQQSKIISGTGGFVKGYAGLGYDFGDFSVGLNYSKMRFTRSAIDHSQFNLFVQVPFTYTAASYASAGSALSSMSRQDGSETVLTLGADNFRQISPQGTNKNTINVADLQFSHFITNNVYWFANAGVGYHGLPLYNQALGGLGYRFPVSSNINLQGQLAVGSGGYAPDTIDTGSGLLVYPKVSVEYLFSKNLGVSLSTGYLYAPKGSSKNYTFGAALNYHLFTGSGGSNASAAGGIGGTYNGYRISVFQQTEFNVSDKGAAQGRLNLLSGQVDSLVGDRLYIPVQISVAYNEFRGFPGYGELLAGIGLQSRYENGDRLQWFGQVLVGTNSRGAILKPGVGVNVALSDRLALYGQAGQTFSVNKEKFRASYAGFGLTYRFSVPSR